MENLKNNFEELKNLLLAAVDILEKTNCVLEERVAALEKEVEVLGKKIDLLENDEDAGSEYEDEDNEDVENEEDEESEEEKVEEEKVEEKSYSVEEAGFAADVENELSGSEEQEQEQPGWFDWEVDYPAEYIEDIYEGVNLNDRYEFVRELFNVTGNLGEAEMIFKETLDDINGMESFKEVVAYIRNRFPQWDEQSDEVYRFYMIARRRFNK